MNAIFELDEAEVRAKPRGIDPMDIGGQRFGRLTVISRVPRPRSDKNIRWAVRCDCGTEKTVIQASLRSGHTQSCGCLASELRVEKNVNTKRTHGMTGTSTYHIHKGMVQRCTNPKSGQWHKYGAKGITVCQRWLDSFSNFLEDMGKAPDGFTIERIDGSKGYTPENCVWADWVTQANNRSNNHVIEHNGVRRTLAEWSRVTGIRAATIRCRVIRGWDFGAAITKPPRLSRTSQ